MKMSAKRRRSKQQIKEDKRKEEHEKNAIVNRLQEITDLKAEINELNSKMVMAADLH